MRKTSFIDKIKEKLSNLLFKWYLRVNNTTEKEYYSQWIGYSKSEFNHTFNNHLKK